ncbi:MAG: DNA polymerase III subunit delta [Defluviitaleaceae bacterium]|nr:DNA polymerase III subunit delta [Defluviitaleaceae bacterium]
MKIYTIVSPYDHLVKNKIKDILTTCHLTPDDVTHYDMQESTIQDALFDVSSAGFLVERKAILVKNPYFLTAASTNGPAHNMEKLIDYLNQPDPENILIFHAPYEKLDERKKVVKLLKKQSDFIKINAPTAFNLLDYARQELARYNITAHDNVMKTFLGLTKHHIDKLMVELIKIRDYFADSVDRELTLELLYDLVPKTLEDNVFLLTEALVTGDRQQAAFIFADLKVQKEEPIKLIVMIANQFRLLKQIQSLQGRGMYEKEIAVALGVHPYRVKVAMGQARRFNIEVLDGILKQLAEADLQIKMGQIDGELALELFILGL